MFHFPRIDRIQAAKIVSMMIETDVDDLQDEAAVEHEMQINRPGFKQVSRDDLRELRKRFIQVADEFDFPEPLSKNKAPVFDRRAARIFETFQVLEPVEAAEPLVQNFIALVLLPDIVKWRWPNREKIGNYARWVGGPRNAIYTIYRQWEVLGETLTEDIIQDQMVGILELSLIHI